MAKSRKITKRKQISKECGFCTEKTEPDYKEHQKLGVYMTERGKIIGKSRTGLCSKHQRKLTIAIKRARHMALLPVVESI